MYTRQREIIDTQLTGTEKFENGVIVRTNYKGEPFRVGYKIVWYLRNGKTFQDMGITNRQITETLDEAIRVIDKWIEDFQNENGEVRPLEQLFLYSTNFYNVSFYLDGIDYICYITEECL